MNDETPKQTKQPYLADVEASEASAQAPAARPKGSKRSSADPALGSNDFLRPEGNIWMWLGFLLVPFAVVLLGYIRGVFDGEEPPPVVQEQVVEESVVEEPTAQRPAPKSGYERAMEIIERQKALRRQD